MKKYLISFAIILAVVVGASFVMGAEVTNDSYSETNQDFESCFNNNAACGFRTFIGQTFTAGSTGYITRVRFYLKKTSTPTGNMTATLHAITGTYGTNSTGTGSALATSNAVDVSTLSTSFSLVEFSFPCGSSYNMTSSGQYAIQVSYSGTSGTAYPLIGGDISSPSHGGNYYHYLGGFSGTDAVFYVYSDSAACSSSPASTVSDTVLFE